MTDIELAYGDDGLTASLPADQTTVIRPRSIPSIEDPFAALRTALANPLTGSPRLRDTVRVGQTVAISICDVTRPQPRELMVNAVLEELAGIVPPEDVVVLVATGTHRACTSDELETMLGRRLLSMCDVRNHDARDEGALVYLGRHGADVPVYLNRAWVEADVRITTGFVEPHFFAGFSGGPKMVAPGLAGLETTLTLHDATRIGHPDARWGICEGNPVHDDVRAIAAATGVDMALDVVLERHQRIAGVFSGDVLSMHALARETARRVAMRPVKERFDVVLTTNSGFPLDQNLYQSVKGMSAAMNIVKPGGVIICAAECRDGLPNHGQYGELLRSTASPADLLENIAARERTIPDQWQVQIQARIQKHADVIVKADGLSDDELRAVHLTPCSDVSLAVREALESTGPRARVCVLPEGPQTIPYVEGEGRASRC